MNTVIRRSICLIGCAVLAGCVTQAPTPTETRPIFYASLASSDGQVDVDTAADLINLYRRNNGLGPLAGDPGLQAMAADASRAMAVADKPASAEALKARLRSEGVADPHVNVSAGYHTLAEAFSGWRDSPAHNQTMLSADGTRFGIATAYAPGSKYKVYWTLIVARRPAR